MATRMNRIIHGDCLKALERLEAGSVDLAFADPPFNIGYDYDEYDDKRSCDDYLEWSRRWISLVIRALKPDGTFWLAIGDEYAAELKVMATRELDLTCRSWVVWYYTFGVHCKYKFTRSHAHLFYFVKDDKTFTFNTDSIRVPSARQLVYGDKRANPKGRVPDDTWIIAPDVSEQRCDGVTNESDSSSDTPGALGAMPKPKARACSSDSPSVIRNPSFVLRPQDLPEGFTPDSDTWYFPRVCGTFKERGGFHGCQMPEQLLGRIIKACSNEGDLILDPFAGSATTLAVAKKLGRQYLGVELSKQYVAESRTRLRRIKPGDPLDGFEDPLKSAPDTQNGTIRTADGKRVKRNGPSKPRGKPKKSEPTRDRDDPVQLGLWG